MTPRFPVCDTRQKVREQRRRSRFRRTKRQRRLMSADELLATLPALYVITSPSNHCDTTCFAATQVNTDIHHLELLASDPTGLRA